MLCIAGRMLFMVVMPGITYVETAVMMLAVEDVASIVVVVDDQTVDVKQHFLHG
jgi:hypothetical protein